MTIKYDLLTYLALGTFLIVIALGAFVLVMTPDTRDLETRKVRFAAVTFTGILTLFVFAAVLYFVDSNPQGPGKEIFDKAVTAMTPLIGAIIGYLFGTHRSRARDVCTGEKTENRSDTT